jgi:hypothetical protein
MAWEDALYFEIEKGITIQRKGLSIIEMLPIEIIGLKAEVAIQSKSGSFFYDREYLPASAPSRE